MTTGRFDALDVLKEYPARRRIGRRAALGSGAAALTAVAFAPTVRAGAAPGTATPIPVDDPDPASVIVGLAQEVMAADDLRAVILQVTVGGEEIVTAALGESMTGVAATTDMRFRNGAVAISYMTTLLLRFVDRGLVRLDDPIAPWVTELPDLPDTDRVTLRMLANMTAGYPDYVQNPRLDEGLYADPFRAWTARELVAIGLSTPRRFAPGMNWDYSHTNYVILGRALEGIGAAPLETLLREEVLDPLGLTGTSGSGVAAIPEPVLHAFTSERRQFLGIDPNDRFHEESTFWNPSWTLAEGAIQMTTIHDMTTTAEAIGTGTLLSPESHRARIAPDLLGFGAPLDGCPNCHTLDENYSYGLGVVLAGDWVLQNPPVRRIRRGRSLAAGRTDRDRGRGDLRRGGLRRAGEQQAPAGQLGDLRRHRRLSGAGPRPIQTNVTSNEPEPNRFATAAQGEHSMDTQHLKTNVPSPNFHRVSRRQAVGYGGAGLAGSVFGVAGLNRDAAAQDSATPVAGSAAPEVTAASVAMAVGQLDAIVAELVERTGVPGLAAAVVYQDEVVRLAGYGIRKVDTGERVDADTVFQLASVSKCLAATTVAGVVGDGNITWDTRISDIDPSLALYDPWVTHEVTVADLFSHRSGMGDHAGDDLEDLGYDRAEILHRLRYLRAEGPFRAHYAYTNFGLTAAAVAAATAVGMAWEDLAATRLYEPLRMTSTSSRFDDFMAATNRAAPHVLVDGSWVARYQRQPDAQSPAGGVSSTVRDLAQWLRLLLAGGTVDGQEIVDTTALDETFRPHSVSNPAADPAADRTGFYGLGWNVNYDEAGGVRLGHSGAFALGAATTVALLPADQLGIVVLSNSAPIGLVEAVAQSFLDLATTGAVTHDWLAIIGPIIEASATPQYGQAVDYSVPPADPGLALDLEAYAGQFTNDYYGDAGITVEGGVLVLHLGPDQTPFEMRHFSHDVFLYQPVGENAGGESAVSFAVGADGLANSVTVENLDISGQGTFARSTSAE